MARIRLVVSHLRGPLAGKELTVVGEKLTIGRDSTMVIQVADLLISRCHGYFTGVVTANDAHLSASLPFHPVTVVFHDTSRNGTYCVPAGSQDTRVRVLMSAHQLQLGDKVMMGNTILRLDHAELCIESPSPSAVKGSLAALLEAESTGPTTRAGTGDVAADSYVSGLVTAVNSPLSLPQSPLPGHHDASSVRKKTPQSAVRSPLGIYVTSSQPPQTSSRSSPTVESNTLLLAPSSAQKMKLPIEDPSMDAASTLQESECKPSVQPTGAKSAGNPLRQPEPSAPLLSDDGAALSAGLLGPKALHIAALRRSRMVGAISVK